VNFMGGCWIYFEVFLWDLIFLLLAWLLPSLNVTERLPSSYTYDGWLYACSTNERFLLASGPGGED
jgi:hypothetical protein